MDNLYESIFLEHAKNSSLLKYILSSIKRQVTISALFVFVVFTGASLVSTYVISTQVVQSMVADMMDTELRLLIKHLGGYLWANIDGGLYCGSNYYGDGTKQEAKIDKFVQFEKDTKTFSYIFIIDENTKLGSVGSTKTRLPYKQGHFLRVAGSTLSPDGTSIVGTYMSKEVSDILDKDGRYQGVANVDGGLIYCIYETLKDNQGDVVGAIVVGRSIKEVNDNIWLHTFYQLGTIFLIILPLVFLLVQVIKYMTNNILKVNTYISLIDGYYLPDRKLDIHGMDEFHDIGENINKMVEKIKLSNEYRKMSETDAMTGMHNRLFISYIFEKVRLDVIKNNLPFCIEIVDIDYFKQFNDNYGHQAGDNCIKMVADTLMSVADDDTIFAARWGGDEFLLMYVGYDKKDVFSMQKQIYDIIHDNAIKHEFSKVNNIVTITQGAYVFDDIKDKSFKELFEEADKVLYNVKETSRDNFAVNDLSSLD